MELTEYVKGKPPCNGVWETRYKNHGVVLYQFNYWHNKYWCIGSNHPDGALRNFKEFGASSYQTVREWRGLAFKP